MPWTWLSKEILGWLAQMETPILQISIPGQMDFYEWKVIWRRCLTWVWSFWRSLNSLQWLQRRPWVTSWLICVSYFEHRTVPANISLKSELIPLTSDPTQATKYQSVMTLLRKIITVPSLHMEITVLPELLGVCHSSSKASRLTDLTGKGFLLEIKLPPRPRHTINSSMTQLLNTQLSKRGVSVSIIIKRQHM